MKQYGLRQVFHAETEADTLQAIREATAVTVDARASMLVVKVTLPGTPRLSRRAQQSRGDLRIRTLAAALANSYVELLQDYRQTTAVFQAQKNRAFIEKQVANAESELKAVETALLAYQDSKGIVSVPEETKQEVAHRAELETDRTAADLERKQAEQQLQVLKGRLLAQAKAGVTEAFPDAQVVVAEARKRLGQLEVELAVKSESLAASNPEVRQLTREIEQTKAGLKEELAKVYGTVEAGLVARLIDLEAEKTAAEAKLRALDSRMAQSRARLAQLPGEAMGVGRLQREVEVKQEVYRLLATEYERAKIEEAKEAPGFDVLDSASVPVRKVAPSGAKNGLLGVFLGLLLGVLAAFARSASGTPELPRIPQDARSGPE